jgi:hypothetical protein
VRDLEEKNQARYVRLREDKIMTQLGHMQSKHNLEREALIKKIDMGGREQEKARRLA